MIRDLRRRDAWKESAVFSSAAAAITFGCHQLFELLRIPSMPDLEAQFSSAHDAWTLKKLVAIQSPSDWSDVILAFIGRLWRPIEFHSIWDVREALGFIASKGGRLVTAPPDQIRRLRSVLIEIGDGNDLLWLLGWLRNEKYCEPTIYTEVTRTAAVRQKLRSINAGARYLGRSRRMSHASRQVRGIAK